MWTQAFGHRSTAEALGRIWLAAEEAVPALRGCLNDPQAAVREAAYRALRRIERNG